MKKEELKAELERHVGALEDSLNWRNDSQQMMPMIIFSLAEAIKLKKEAKEKFPGDVSFRDIFERFNTIVPEIANTSLFPSTEIKELLAEIEQENKITEAMKTREGATLH